MYILEVEKGHINLKDNDYIDASYINEHSNSSVLSKFICNTII